MIDTLVLRIHNLKNYTKLYEQYYNPIKKRGTITSAFIQEDTGELIETTYSPALVFHDTNRILNPNFRSHLNIASSHYELAYSVNSQKDYLEFNFSIPKYESSTNVLQFINEYDQGYSMTFLKLMTFIDKFMRENFVIQPLPQDVEINRIDLCYNQHFNSKDDALQYLEEQKKLNIKFARSSKNNVANRSTSLMYVTRRYSFKIYHKGTEFAINDYKELVKNGNPKNLPLQYFLDESDKILRYELTFRSSYLWYLLQENLFKKKDSTITPEYTNHPIQKFWNVLIGAGFQKIYTNYLRTSKFFTLKSFYDLDFPIQTKLDAIKSHNSQDSKIEKRYHKVEDTITFDQTVFKMLYDTFWNKVKDYQLTQVMDVPTLEKAIDNIEQQRLGINRMKLGNHEDKLRFDKNKLLFCALLINQGMTLDNLKNYMPKTTYYRLKGQLNKLGVTSNNVGISITPPRIDYLDYRLIFSKYHNV